MAIANQLKTTILLAVLTALLLYIGSFWSTSGLIIAGVFIVIMNFAMYFFSDKIVLMMYKAKEIQEHEDKELFRIVNEVAHLANVPMPKVYIIPTQQLNAFATGRNPKHSAVACTEGIIHSLSKDELKGVIAHEISHIKNRDTLIQVVAGTIAGVIAFVASMARWAAIFGGFGGRDNDSGNLIQLIVLAIVAPLAATIIQLAISRSREFLADETAAKMLHNPHGLAKALEKISASVKHHPLNFGNPSTSAIFISNPFRSSGILNLFSTHPPVEKRIQKLKSLQV
ncbi:MAG: zinc metalloprotease HtpX [Candidatus Woesearchaeota archaeon]